MGAADELPSEPRTRRPFLSFFVLVLLLWCFAIFLFFLHYFLYVAAGFLLPAILFYLRPIKTYGNARASHPTREAPDKLEIAKNSCVSCLVGWCVLICFICFGWGDRRVVGASSWLRIVTYFICVLLEFCNFFGYRAHAHTTTDGVARLCLENFLYFLCLLLVEYFLSQHTRPQRPHCTILLKRRLLHVGNELDIDEKPVLVRRHVDLQII